MTTHVCAWRIELINAYRDLFRPPPEAPVLAQGYPDCGPGWRDLLARACARIRAAVGAEERVEILQVKEKRGTLRIYWQGKLCKGSRAKVEEAVALSEARSACTCEECGEEGRLYRKGGVLMTRCALHAQGDRVRATPGSENIHIVRLSELQDPFTCRRYDRATDSFIDVDLGSHGIEEN